MSNLNKSSVIYFILYTSNKTPIFYLISLNKNKENFIGCFKIIQSYFSYNQGFLFNRDMNIAKCKTFCKKHIYQWLKKG